jgi:phage terminase Nu1 subunit (DNA packaging protein)
MTPTSCTVTEFAASWAVSRPTIVKRIAEGMPVIKASGDGLRVKINPAEANPWMLRRERNSQNPDPNGLSLEAERKRLIKAQADHEELDYLVKCGELIYFDMVLDMISNLAVLVKSSIQNLGGRLANELIDEPNPAVIKARVDSEAHAVVAAVSQGAGEMERQLQEAKRNATDG